MTTDVYATADELKEYVSAPGLTGDDSIIDAALVAASRNVDAYCGRFFYQLPASTAYFSPDPGSLWLLDLGDADLYDTAGLDVAVQWSNAAGYNEPWTFGTDYIAEPVNQSVQGVAGWPFTSLRALGGKSFPPQIADFYRDTVRIVGDFGWPAVPAPVKLATLMGAAELVKMGDAPFGVAGFGQFGSIRVRDNPKIATLLLPYKKGTTLFLA
jgi:hypothetical protein